MSYETFRDEKIKEIEEYISTHSNSTSLNRFLSLRSLLTEEKESLDSGGARSTPIQDTSLVSNLTCYCLQAGANGCVIASLTGPTNFANWSNFPLAPGQAVFFPENVTSLQLSSGEAVAYDSL